MAVNSSKINFVEVMKKSECSMYRYLKTDPFALPLWRDSPRGSSFGSLVTLGVPQPTKEREKHLNTVK